MLKYIQKHKQKLLKYIKLILLGFCLANLLLSAEPTYAFVILGIAGIYWILAAVGAVATTGAVLWVNSLGGLGEAFVKLLVDIVNTLVAVILAVLMPIIMTVYQNVLEYPDYLLGLDVTIQTWSLILAVANGFFLLALLIASIAIILRINTGVYNIKKFLGGFIAAVILSNLSLLIVRALVGIGNMLYSIIQKSFNTNEVIEKLFDSGVVAEIPKATTGDLVGALFMLIFVILIFFIILKITLILVERMLWIFLLALVAPIAFALGLLPVTQKLVSQWWEALIKWILVLPLTFGLIALGTVVMTGGSGDIDKLMHDLLHVDPNALEPGKIIPIIGGLALLYLAGTAGKMLKVGGALSGIVGENAFQGVGRLYKGIAGTFTGKGLAGKALYGTGKIARGTYDRGKREVIAGAVPESLGGKWLKEKVTTAQAAWDANTLLNPKARKDKQEADNKRAIAFETFSQDAQRINNYLDPLDTAAQIKHPGKDWYDLDSEEQTNLLAANPNLKANKKQLGDAYGTMMWRARKFAHETNIADLDPATMLEQNLLNSETKTGEGITAAINLSRIATSNNHPEKALAQEILVRNKKLLQEKYKLNPNKLIKIKAKSAFDSDIQLIDTQKQLNSAQEEENVMLDELSGLGLDKRMAQKIVEEGLPSQARGLADINELTLDTLINKEGLDVKNMTRMTTIKEAIDGPDDETKEKKALLIIDMLNSGVSIKEMVAYKKLGSGGLGDEEMQSTHIQKLLEKLGSAKTVEQKSEETISEIKNVHLKQVNAVKRVVRENVTGENRQTMNTAVTTHYDNISSQVSQDPSIQKVGQLNLSPEQQEEIRQSITDAKADLGLSKDLSELSVGDLLHKLRLIRDATAEEN